MIRVTINEYTEEWFVGAPVGRANSAEHYLVYLTWLQRGA
jgi:hypothetical protein